MEDMSLIDSIMVAAIIAYPVISGVYLLTTADEQSDWLRYFLGSAGIGIGILFIIAIIRTTGGK